MLTVHLAVSCRYCPAHRGSHLSRTGDHEHTSSHVPRLRNATKAIHSSRRQVFLRSSHSTDQKRFGHDIEHGRFGSITPEMSEEEKKQLVSIRLRYVPSCLKKKNAAAALHLPIGDAALIIVSAGLRTD